MAGTLILVATPIGNLGDLSPRAVEVLSKADVVACEDTRRTGRLLAHAGVSAPRLLVVNEHTETAGAGEIAGLVAGGSNVALVTDAGTPAVSDPGAKVVEAVVEAGGEVEAVPGPSAALAALVVSGLPTGRFCFEGFLPRRGRARAERLEQIARERRTTVVYESPHRLRSCLGDLAAACGPSRGGVVARELTKLHEEILESSLGEISGYLAAMGARGELTVVVDVGGVTETPVVDQAVIEERLRERLQAGMRPGQAAGAVGAVPNGAGARAGKP